jgi:hypothetical protein
MIHPEQVINPYGDFNSTRTAFRCALAAGAEDPKNEIYEAIFHIPPSFDIGLPQFKKLGWEKWARDGNYYYKWEDWRKANRDFLIGNWPLNDYFERTIPDGASADDCWEAKESFNRIFQGRRLAVSSMGYLGWVPENPSDHDEGQTREGDLFCIIFGCSTPIVLRPFHGYYKVVGEGYLHGFMDGEALKLLDSRVCNIQHFKIR